jgi:hypothetical protein
LFAKSSQKRTREGARPQVLRVSPLPWLLSGQARPVWPPRTCYVAKATKAPLPC